MNNREEEEQLLVERTQSNDRRAFDEIVRRYQHRLQSYAARMLLGDSSTASDLAVEALVRLWERRHEYRHCDRLASWLYRTTHRLVLDELSRTRVQASLDSTFPDHQNVHQIVEVGVQAQAAKEAVSQLSIHLRTVFILSIYQEMSYQEIADALEISPGTVASRKHEAVQILRQKMLAWKETQ